MTLRNPKWSQIRLYFGVIYDFNYGVIFDSKFEIIDYLVKLYGFKSKILNGVTEPGLRRRTNRPL